MTESIKDTALRRTKLCEHFIRNRCRFGSDCSFAHSADELLEKPNLRKTILCVRWNQKGYCKDGSSCRFAHGRAELRPAPAPKQSSTTTATSSGFQYQHSATEWEPQWVKETWPDMEEAEYKADGLADQSLDPLEMDLEYPRYIEYPQWLAEYQIDDTEVGLPLAAMLSTMLLDHEKDAAADAWSTVEQAMTTLNNRSRLVNTMAQVAMRASSSSTVPWTPSEAEPVIRQQATRLTKHLNAQGTYLTSLVSQLIDVADMRRTEIEPPVPIPAQDPYATMEADSYAGGEAADHSADRWAGGEIDLAFAYAPKEGTLKYTKMCHFYLAKGCKRGDRCKFAHDSRLLMPRPNLLKTGVCGHFARGRCSHGEACRYAHGLHELRPLSALNAEDDADAARLQ
eukprot:TRINITY_DN19915_c0_g1_i4.p1 TRINITY_DN19915_c0_g1~~TRINITY_DN19915_c0_g1_i4.p1  ORF type:complete len:397 (-),score=65.51 TRINITY_DN19915_c0_g1_i4:120-1310(-)